MEVKSGYKLTDVGVIPESWEVRRIADFASVRSGGTPSREIGAFWGGTIPWITTSQIDFGEITEADQFITEEGLRNSAAKMLPAGTLLMALYGQGKTRGKVGVLGISAATNQACASISLDKSVSREFILQFLASRYEEIRKSSNSGSQENLSGNIVKNLQVVIPPLPEQQSIAGALSDVVELLNRLDRLIVKKRDLKQAAMQQLLTGKTRLASFNTNWDVKKLGEICEIEMGRTPPRANQAFWGPGYKWLSIADLQSKVVSYSKEEITELAASTMTIIPKGTLLMSFKLSLGRLCFAGCDLFTNEAICSFNKLQANADFLYYQLGRTDFSLYGKQAVKGYTLNKDSLKAIEITLPSLPEQAAIADVLMEMDAELDALEQRREKTRFIKQGMMQQLLTGKVRLI